MTVALASIWETGWDTPLRESDLWRFLVDEFQLDGGIWMTPVSGIHLRDDSGIHERASMADVLTELNLTAVFFDQDGDEALRDFVHPESCVYVTGSTLASSLSFKRPGDLSVRIETPGGTGGLWSHQAACLALYDRQAKSWPQP